MIRFEKTKDKDWNKNINSVSLTLEFSNASRNVGEIYFASEDENKAIIIIKKKGIKVFSRAQIFSETLDKKFIESIIIKLKDMNIPYARLGNTMFGINNKIKFNNSEIIKRHTYIIDLKKSVDDIWRDFNKKLRNVIRKAEKSSIVEEIKDLKDLEEYYRLSKLTEENIKNDKGRKSFSIPDYDFFKSVYENKVGKFFIAKYNGKIIAGALFLIWKKRSIYYQSFLDKENRDKQAPSLIQWEAIKNLKKSGIEIFDLGGVTIDLDKSDSRFYINEFKRKFNGELIEFYNIEFEISKIKKIQDFLIKRLYN